MGEYASLDDLVNVGVDNTEDVEVTPGVIVKVRGLTRYELLLNAKGVDGDGAMIERRNLVTCMVEPKLSLQQAEKWQKSSMPGVIGKVTDAIRRLSGLGADAPKSSVPANGDESGA